MQLKAINFIWAGEYGRHKPGAIFELPAEDAQGLLALGAVELVETPVLPEPASANATEPDAAPTAPAPKRKR